MIDGNSFKNCPPDFELDLISQQQLFNLNINHHACRFNNTP